jgi:hypothetical protein
MAKDKAPAPAEPPTRYVALTGLNYWSAGQLRKVSAGQVVDDIPAAAVDNWLTINPPAIRIATDDDTKGVTP